MKKGVVLVIVMGVMLIIFTLAFVALFLMTQESRVAEHKIKRMRGYFASKAGVVDAYEELRLAGKNCQAGTPETYTISNFGSGLEGYPPNGLDIEIVVLYKGESVTYPPGGVDYTCPADIPSDCCIFSRVNYQ